MLGTEHIGVFITTGLLLNATPGPDTFYILGRTLSQGREAGVASVLGICAGCLVHTIAAGLGLSTILAASATAFLAVKLLGAGYLLYLGIGMLLEKTRKEEGTTRQFAREDFRVIFRQGVITNVLNPKVALFFLAFLPQFVSNEAQGHVLPFLFLGALFIFNGMIYCLLLVVFAAAISKRFRTGSGTTTILKKGTGALFAGLGLKLAMEK